MNTKALIGLSMILGVLVFWLSSTDKTASETPEQIVLRVAQEKIVVLLQQGRQQLENSQYSQPPGSNAFETYTEVLELDSTNTEAQSGLNEIADQYVLLSKNLQGGEDPAQSLSTIAHGLTLFPENKKLLAMQDAIMEKALLHKKEKAVRQKQKEMLKDVARQREDNVLLLLAQAEEQLLANRLTQPAEDNAYDTFKKVLSIESRNSRALEGLSEIAGRYEKLAVTNKEKKAWKKALGFVDRGLGIVPDHAGLLALKKELQQQAKVSKQKNQRVGRWLKLAKTSSGKKAYDYYQQVLALDAGNRAARLGVRKVMLSFEKTARGQRDKGKLEDSLSTVKAGLKLFPDHSVLLMLKEEIKQQILALERRKKSSEQVGEKAKLRDLQKRARIQIRAKRYIEPVGNNALETYQDILDIDDENKTARRGIEKLVKYFYTQALVKRRANDFSGSLLLVEKGLIVDDSHAKLLALKGELEEAQAESVREAEAQQKKKERSQEFKVFGTF